MFSREKCAFNKFRKSRIKFKEFFEEVTPLEVSDTLLLIGSISLIIFFIGACSMATILPVLCNTYPTLGVKFFYIIENVIYIFGGTALITVSLGLVIYNTYFDEDE